MANRDSILSLKPEDDIGHQFVFYGDCCSGLPGHPFEKNFSEVNSALQRLSDKPDFVLFLGDHIVGPYRKRTDIREQWTHWFEKEMSWFDFTQTPMYHTTSNHNTFDTEGEKIWQEVFSNLPDNGPKDQKKMSYWVKSKDLLLVVVNTSFSALGGLGHVECDWLNQVLEEHKDVPHKIVAGHYPAFPVNGYTERPTWCIVEDEADAFWKVLVKHNVIAYLCSHVLAFDIQEHDSVLQICSAGAGTFLGEKGFMGDDEYHHFVQASLDHKKFQLQTVDKTGAIRETYIKNL